MRYETSNGFDGFKVVDDATGETLTSVMWVDDDILEYCCLTYDWMGGMAEVTVSVSAVSVNYATREIHVNAPRLMVSAPVMLRREPTACRECTNECSCKRIGMCLRFKCGYGEVETP